MHAHIHIAAAHAEDFPHLLLVLLTFCGPFFCVSETDSLVQMGEENSKQYSGSDCVWMFSSCFFLFLRFQSTFLLLFWKIKWICFKPRCSFISIYS